MPVPFSTWEKLKLAFRLTCLAPWQIFASIVRTLSIAWARGVPSRLYLVCAVVKVFLGTFSARQIQYLSLPTKEAYKSWIKQKAAKEKKIGNTDTIERLSHDVEPLEDGNSSILWIGDQRKAKKVVLFFHGGGYISPLLPGHLEWCWRAYIAAGIEAKTEVAVAVLEYTLCPEARYPVQLRQAASALTHLLSQQVRPGDIVIGGDSAGGNLTAQLLSHLVEPHPTVPRVALSEPLQGAFLVSPWVTRHTNDASYMENSWIDMLSGPTVDKCTKELLGDTPTDESYDKSAILACPLDGGKSWMKGITSILDRMYVTVGSHEVFRDQAAAFAHEVQYSNPELNVQFALQTRQAHDFILLEAQQERDGECILEMREWMKDVLAREVESGSE
ncbi:Abhydrolase-3 domain-containing protein [Fusarium sp. LHS14.1]|nr:Abhydrolase-3 domain-containing protein [Fusarium sp. LHS14.1]